MAESQFVYVAFIRTTPEKLWRALMEPEFTRQFWMGTTQESEWKVGSSWRIVKPDGKNSDSGEVVEIEPHRRLVLNWQNHLFPEMTAEGFSRMTYELEQKGDMVKLTVTHGMEKSESVHQGCIEWLAHHPCEPEEPARNGGISGSNAELAGGDVGCFA